VVGLFMVARAKVAGAMEMLLWLPWIAWAGGM
jgi:hypothetical protein